MYSDQVIMNSNGEIASYLTLLQINKQTFHGLQLITIWQMSFVYNVYHSSAQSAAQTIHQISHNVSNSKFLSVATLTKPQDHLHSSP